MTEEKENTKQTKAQARDARLQQALRDNLRRRKAQVKQRMNVEDKNAPLPRDGKIGVAKLKSD